MKFLGIIPARYASTRFPGKPLAQIGGKPMIQRTYEAATNALGEGNVAVATDDTRIFDAVEAFGGKVVMTSAQHRSGTDRCMEAYDNLESDADIIINVQGDEPFLRKEQIDLLKDCFQDPSTEIATLARRFSGNYNDLRDPNTPKVVTDLNGFALYFSRSIIPFLRGEDPESWPEKFPFCTHIGIYGFRKDILRSVCHLPQSNLEKAESLEQLRWLSNGFRIKVALTDLPNIGIDTPEDLASAERLLKEGLC